MQPTDRPEDKTASLAALLDQTIVLARQHDRASAEHAKAVQIMLALGRNADAQRLLAETTALRPGTPGDHEALGFAAFQAGLHEIARAFYARVVSALPGDGLAWYNLASSDRNLGQLDEAEDECNRALDLDQSLAQAALLRSQLRVQTADRNHVEALRSMQSRTAANVGQQVFLCYALGKELDDLGEYDAAFAQFAQGARIRRANLEYDVRQDALKLERIIEAFDACRLTDSPPLRAPDYGFIVGLPRSGTTLIERILTGSAQAVSNGETDNLFGALGESAATEGRDIFERVASADPARVAQGYARRAGHAEAQKIVLEKLPFNYLYAGAIRLTLPNARTLLVQRAPADNCFAMYSTLFGSGYPFSYSLEELAAYFIAYNALINHWKKVVGDQLLDVAYEDVVSDPLWQGRRIAGHFGVAWHDQMVVIENNRTATATASAAQVRRPIYGTAKGRWRNYVRHLEPLLKRLEMAGIDPTRVA